MKNTLNEQAFPSEQSSWPPEGVELKIETPFELFYLTSSGVYFERGNKKGKFCSYLKVEGTCENTTDGTEGRLISFPNCSGKKQRKYVKNSACISKQQHLVSQLVNSGLTLFHFERGFSSMLGRLIYCFPVKKSSHFRFIATCGWFYNYYVTPTVTYSARGVNKKILFSQGDRAAVDFSCKGSIEEWIDGIASVAVISPLITSCLCYAFSGPLIGRLHPEMASSGLYLAGSSSIGKSLCGAIAEGVYGDPAKRAKTWDVTNSSILGIAVTRNHNFVLIDETKTSRGSVMDAIYSLSANQTASRSNQDGTLRPSRKFQITYICTGETSLDNLTKLQSGHLTDAGAHVRCLNIDCDSLSYKDKDPRSFGIFSGLSNFVDKGELFSHLYSRIEQYHGTVGREWIIKLAKFSIDELSSKVVAYETDFWAQINSIYGKDLNDQTRRVLMGLRIRAAAGELASEFGLTGWDPGLAIQSCVWLFGEWRKSFSGLLIESDQILNRLKEICQQLHLFIPLKDRDRCSQNILGFRNFVTDQNGHSVFEGRKKQRLLFLLDSTFYKISGNSSPKKTFEILKENGVMEFSIEGGRERKRLQIKTSERFYTVNYDKFLEFIQKEN